MNLENIGNIFCIKNIRIKNFCDFISVNKKGIIDSNHNALSDIFIDFFEKNKNKKKKIFYENNSKYNFDSEETLSVNSFEEQKKKLDNLLNKINIKKSNKTEIKTYKNFLDKFNSIDVNGMENKTKIKKIKIKSKDLKNNKIINKFHKPYLEIVDERISYFK